MQARKPRKDFREATVQYSLTYRDVVEILKLVRDSGHGEEVELSIGDFKLKFRRSNGQSTSTAMASVAVPDIVTEKAPAEPAKQNANPKARHQQTGVSSAVVSAPMLGTFYRSPEPGAKPFVDVGSVIVEGDTIGLIEVMKLFSPVLSEVAGEVVEILAENGTLVEYGEPLIRLQPKS